MLHYGILINDLQNEEHLKTHLYLYPSGLVSSQISTSLMNNFYEMIENII